MDTRKKTPRLDMVAEPWLHVSIIAALIVSRRPAAIFHPQFWAEDGQVFYHDAYTIGWPALLHPLGGYLNTFSRLAAALAVQLPLNWGPVIFAALALAAQLLPPFLLTSSRLQAALPSFRARLALAYFYAAQPNSYELNIVLTNAQWHLAIAAFLLVCAQRGAGKAGRVLDPLFLLVSGLSGPFSIFLAPVAWLVQRETRCRASLINAIVLSATALVQLSFILLSHAAAGRLATPLGASFADLTRILVNRVFLGGLIGDPLMLVLLTTHVANTLFFSCLLAVAGLVLAAAALAVGPVLLRRAAWFAAFLFIAALLTPMASSTQTQWNAMALPGNGLRYFVWPVLVWFGALLALKISGAAPLRVAARFLLVFSLSGIITDFFYPAWRQTGFTAAARLFATAPSGTVMIFPENPPGWQMTLVKH